MVTGRRLYTYPASIESLHPPSYVRASNILSATREEKEEKRRLE
jgi:hypothetical protein